MKGGLTKKEGKNGKETKMAVKFSLLKYLIVCLLLFFYDPNFKSTVKIGPRLFFLKKTTHTSHMALEGKQHMAWNVILLNDDFNI